MTLPPKAIEALIDIRKELISLPVEEPPKPEEPKRERHSTQKMRHAKRRGEQFQRFMRTGGF